MTRWHVLAFLIGTGAGAALLMGAAVALNAIEDRLDQTRAFRSG